MYSVCAPNVLTCNLQGVLGGVERRLEIKYIIINTVSIG